MGGGGGGGGEVDFQISKKNRLVYHYSIYISMHGIKQLFRVEYKQNR